MPKPRQILSAVLQEPFYPLLIAISPALFLYQHNIHELTLTTVYIPMLVIVVFVCLGMLLLNLILRNWYKTSAVTASILFVFFLYQPLVLLLPDILLHLGQFSLGRGKVLLPLTLIALLVTFYTIWRSQPVFVRKLAQPLNIFALLLVGFTSLQIGFYESSRLIKNLSNPTAVASVNNSGATIQSKPDIYYFIFDRYAGDKTLTNVYGFDNSPFLDGLTQRGFYVAHDSHTNYPSTELSISSSLSMDYHQPYEGSGPRPDFTTDIYPKIWNAKVAVELKSFGYKYYQVASRYMPTAYSNVADELFLVKPQSKLNLGEFSTELLQSTIVNAVDSSIFNSFVDLDYMGSFLNAHQTQQRELPNIINFDGPKFVFTHVLLPHDPYVVDKECTPIALDKRAMNTNLPAYLDQLQCANKLADTWIDQILASTKGQAIIIVQADEGPFPLVNLLPQQKNFSNASTEAIQERTRILNAYYFPNKDYTQLYQAITPVNSFRTVLRQYFGVKIDNLQDKTFVFPSEENIFAFINATDKVSTNVH